MSDRQQLIGRRYELIDLIGAGGMGQVHRAHDRLTDAIVALKQVMIPNEQLVTNSTPDPTQQSHISLATEFRMLATLRHPHIISVLDYGFDENQRPYFTMELLEDAHPITDIATHLESQEKINLILQMLQALAYLHRRGILHRDLKPDNVLVTQSTDGQYQAKLLDFGLASNLDLASSSPSIVGTLAYLAPEILQQEPATQVADLYAVGMMSYELLAGQYPFEMTRVVELMQSILYTRPRTTVPGIDRPIGSILRRLLDKSPTKRYQNAEAVITAFADATENTVSLENSDIRESFLQAAKFIGRDTEFKQLTGGLLSALDNHGSIWLVGGESGIGKSRLLDELRTVALVEGMLVLRGQAISEGSMPYHIWRDIIRRLILSASLTNEQASILKEIIPDIEQLLKRPITDAPQLNDVAQKERLIDTIVQVLTQPSQPTLILLEDLHWATDSLEPLVQLSSKLGNKAVCIIASYRIEEKTDLGNLLPKANTLILQRLKRDEIENLSMSMVGKASQQPGVIDLVERETEGNTFFIVEVMRALAEDAGQLDDIGRITLPASVVTGGIHQVIARRMKHVPSEFHPLLSLASVVGRQLDLQVLQHAIATYEEFQHINLFDWLSACENASVIGIQDEQWKFSHDKLREYLLQELPNKQELHQYSAEAIESVYPEDINRHTRLAELWLIAGDDPKATHYGVQAAKQMQNVSNYHTAINLLYSIIGKWDQNQIETGLQCDFFYRLGDLNERISENEIANDYFDRSYQLALSLDDPIRLTDALRGKSVIAYNMSQYDEAIQYLEEALRLGEIIAHPETIASVYKVLSNVYSQRGNYTISNEYLQKSLHLSQLHNIKIEIAGSLNNLGVNAYLMGNYDIARDYYQQALTVYEAVGYRGGVALCYSNLGDVAFDEGLNQQIEYYEKGLAIYRDIGNLWGMALCMENSGSSYYLLGNYDKAIAMFEAALQISQKTGDQYAIQHELMELGFLYNHQGDYAQAEIYINQSLELIRELESQSILALCLGYSAYNDIDLERYDDAMTKLQEGISLVDDAEAETFALDLLAVYARLIMVREDYPTSLLLCEFLLSQNTLEDVTRQLIVQPVHDTLLSLVSEEQHQQTVTQAQNLKFDDALQLMLAHKK